ncbi:Rho GTPase-activating protein 5 [Merluccius polli]|uniref:Rho GTPase-activating protein 5 n=1 Tax=Merluccius polli TaxID=89951 RepID=A0AA47MWZ2_MERPO|nr:Rho GTPase-activating protein 5 [Merluccius polli]
MAKNRDARPPTFAVSVVGLSGTEKEKGNCGVGKSCLCNRYVRSHADGYYPEHTSVLSTIDFGGRVVNNDHFLYWGEVAHHGDDGLDCKIQLVEQTEFIDDQTFLPHRSTNLQPYTKRSAASKLQSAEKLMYICTDQLGLEQDFDQKQMPDGKLTVDGFMLCVDVSKGCNRKFDDQMKFVGSLYAQIGKSKKPIVLAATKCDECVEQHLRELQAFAASKKNLVVVETSARTSVNVEPCFHALIQQMDKTRGKPKTVSYLEAYKVQRQLVAMVTDRFEKVVLQTVRDYHITWKTVINTLKGQPDYEDFIIMEGTRKARNTFDRHIAQLKQEHIRRRREEYLTSLPKTLNNLLNNLEEIEHLTWSEAQSLIRSRPDFQCWFVVLEHTPWDESDHIDNSDRRVPFDLLKTADGERIYQNHVQHLFSEKKRVEMKERFQKTLQRVQFISAGQPWEEVMCFVMEDEAYKYISESDRRDVYSRHQLEIVERAKEDFQEMLFEHAELFYDLDLNATPSGDKMSEIHCVLNEEPRYRALQKLGPDRESLLLKHIGFVYHPTKQTCLSGPSCVDLKVEQVLANRLVQLDLRSNHYHNTPNIHNINLCLLGKEGLAQELANEIRAQSTDNEYTLDGKIYELDLLPVDVNSTLLFSHSWVSTFKPHGCFCVFNSIESLNSVGDCIGRIRAEIAQNRRERFAQPLPFILVLANQRDGVCKNTPILRHKGQQLANKLQCTFVDIPSGAFPRKFNEHQIKQGLRAVLEGLKHNSEVLSPLPSIKDISETDLRIVMCAMCWDPFSVDLILSPFLDSQCCSAGQPGQSNTLILDKIIGDTRRRIQVTVLSYHSSIGVRRDELVHGYILVYSAKRKASMATLRAFLAEVQDVIPVQMVAITDSQADFFENDAIKELMTEGEHIATEIAAKFTALYSLSQYHRQTEVFTPFFNEVLERKPGIENAFMLDSSSRDCSTTAASEDVFPNSPHSHSPVYNPYYDSEDDTEAPPPYSPIGDDVQLLPTPSERARYRIDLEGNEYPVHSTPNNDHDRNHKVPPPVLPKPVLPKPTVRKLDPNLVRTIEAGMRSTRRSPRGTLAHGDDQEASDNYADPADTLRRSKCYNNDDIYAVPEDTHSRMVKCCTEEEEEGEEENGLDRRSHTSRRPSKYKHRSKILFSKTKAYQRRFHSDSDGEESGRATQKKKKGRAHRGSEEDPLLSPTDGWKGGIDNPAVTSDPEQDDKKLKKKKTSKPPKEPKKPKSSKPAKPLYPPTRRTWDSNYFGVPLQSLVTPERPVPLFIEKCVGYIERIGLTTEGLYRVSGNKTDQDNIQKQFDQDPGIDLVVMDVAVNAVAGALKAFFADLPDPLIPYALHPELVEAAKIVDYMERLQVLREIVNKFPPVNFLVFKYIITHLNRVSQQSKTTLMTADNLSICFWPTLMRPDFENPDTLSTTKLSQAVVEDFIRQSHYFFYGGEVADSSGSEGTPPPHHCHNMVEALLPLQLPPPLQPQQIQHPDPPTTLQH